MVAPLPPGNAGEPLGRAGERLFGQPAGAELPRRSSARDRGATRALAVAVAVAVAAPTLALSSCVSHRPGHVYPQGSKVREPRNRTDVVTEDFGNEQGLAWLS